jgi:excisionase family DNA binding protein
MSEPNLPEGKAPSNLQLYTVAECAAILAVSQRSVSKWIRSGVLPAVRLGPAQRLWRVRHQDLLAFIEGGTDTSQSSAGLDEQGQQEGTDKQNEQDHE